MVFSASSVQSLLQIQSLFISFLYFFRTFSYFSASSIFSSYYWSSSLTSIFIEVLQHAKSWNSSSALDTPFYSLKIFDNTAPSDQQVNPSIRSWLFWLAYLLLSHSKDDLSFSIAPGNRRQNLILVFWVDLSIHVLWLIFAFCTKWSLYSSCSYQCYQCRNPNSP